VIAVTALALLPLLGRSPRGTKFLHLWSHYVRSNQRLLLTNFVRPNGSFPPPGEPTLEAAARTERFADSARRIAHRLSKGIGV